LHARCTHELVRGHEFAAGAAGEVQLARTGSRELDELGDACHGQLFGGEHAEGKMSDAANCREFSSDIERRLRKLAHTHQGRWNPEQGRSISRRQRSARGNQTVSTRSVVDDDRAAHVRGDPLDERPSDLIRGHACGERDQQSDRPLIRLAPTHVRTRCEPGDDRLDKDSTFHGRSRLRSSCGA
jgi:hypothetical protein